MLITRIFVDFVAPLRAQPMIIPLLLMGQVLDGGPPLAGSRLDAAVVAVMLHRYGVEG